jgi:hypothetical protein
MRIREKIQALLWQDDAALTAGEELAGFGSSNH